MIGSGGILVPITVPMGPRPRVGVVTGRPALIGERRVGVAEKGEANAPEEVAIETPDEADDDIMPTERSKISWNHWSSGKVYKL